MPSHSEKYNISDLKGKLQRLTKLLLLEQKARQKKDDLELGFTIVNHTHELCAYKRCMYWVRNGKNIKCLHASGISKIDEGATFHKHYTKLIKRVVQRNSKTRTEHWARLTEINLSTLPDKEQKHLRDHISDYVLIIEFISPKGMCFSGLTIENENPFSESDKALLEHVCESYAHALYSLNIQNTQTSSLISGVLKNKKTTIVAACVIGAMFIPIRSSITVPAEIIAQDPYIVSAPIEGIIEDIFIQTNQLVSLGDQLASLDDTEIRNRLEIALKELEVLKTDMEQSSRQAFTERKSKAQITIIKGEIERQEAEISYLREVLSKTTITSPRDGIALFNDPNKKIGQIFKTGQKIMSIANPEQIELELRIPADSLIQFDKAKPIALYLNEDPLKAHNANLNYIEFEATKDPDGLLTYKAYAQVHKQFPIGARGSAKIYGQDTILGEQIFRRPIVSLRRHLMW